MRRELLELASDLARRGEPFAIATVVARKSPMSAQPGDTALVTREGGFHGWVGGSCTRPTVIAQALAALADSQPRLVALDPDPDGYRRPGLTVFPMTCHSGGSVEIHIQPVLPSPDLVVYGASPIARALLRLGKSMGYRVHAVDPTADEETFAGADSVSTDPVQLRLAGSAAPVFVVVATQGAWDEPAILAGLAQGPQYLSVVASPRRFAEMRAQLADRAPAEALAAVKNPAGLDLGGRLPEEIALGILAEIVQEHRKEKARQPAIPAAAPAPEAQDPVCGMTVHNAASAPRAEYKGRTYLFCCPGCQQRFQSAPDRYLGGFVTPAIEELGQALEGEGYIAEPAIATALFLMQQMGKPLLVEGDAGVGKTELAKVLARLRGTDLIRLQCYQGLDVQTALYEWDYGRQLLQLRIAESRGEDKADLERRIFSRQYLLERPLLSAITRPDRPAVLLVDEVDRADDAFEAFLLEVLSDWQVSIPELGTIRAAHPPLVLLTSNRTRELGDALRRRCLYLHIDHPSFDKEVQIIRRRCPESSGRLGREIAGFVAALRARPLVKPPGVAETLDFARALLILGQPRLLPEVVAETLGCLLKDGRDLETVTGEDLASMVAQAQQAGATAT